MGTWAEGILDNDSTLDGLGDLRHEVVNDILAFGETKPTAASTNKLCAAVGLLLQLSSYDFKLDGDSGPKIIAAVKAHEKSFTKLPSAARKLLALILDGKGEELAKRPEKMSPKTAKLLHTERPACPFGKREASLFESKEAATYVQSFAKRCIETIEEDFEDEDNWSDLCREGMGMAGLAALLVVGPCRVPVAKIARWRKNAKKGLAALEANPDDELDFHRKYYANLDKVYALLETRFAS